MNDGCMPGNSGRLAPPGGGAGAAARRAVEVEGESSTEGESMHCHVGVRHWNATTLVAGRSCAIVATFAALVGLSLLVAGADVARAQAPDSAAGGARDEARATGLPKKVTWTFNFDAGAGMFGFANSLYTNPKPDPSGDLSDNWAESFVKPAISGNFPMKKGELYGKISAVGERTFMAPPPLVGSEASSFQAEDLSLGWRSGKSVGSTENALDFTIGRAPYKIGHLFLLSDGAAEGGSRGGYWSNARKAWKFAGVGRFKVKHSTLEGFYLERDEIKGSETGTKVSGANYELAVGEASTFGASYLKVNAHKDVMPQRDGMNVYDARAFTAPLRKLPALAFELEYAREDNGDLVSAQGWTAQAAYELTKRGWSPKLSYRYAAFGGDDPTTTKSEAFDPLLPGFYDWGTWWQGEIGGEYFLSNSDLVSHQVRLHLKPSEALGTGLIGYVFKLDQQPAGVTSKDIASEVDAYADWKVNGNFLVSFVAAFAHPQKFAEEAFNRKDDFKYGMIYVAYSY